MAKTDSSPQPRRRRRWLRWLLIAGGVLLLAGVGAIALARRALPELERSVTAALGMPVRIEGLSVSPWRGAVALGPVSIGREADILGAARIAITPRLETLWQDHIVIERVEIDDVTGVLHLDENYQPLFRSVMTGERAASTGAYHVTVRELIVRGGAVTVRYPVRKKTRDGTLHITRLHATNVDVGRMTGPAPDMSGAFEGAFDGAPVHATTVVRPSGAQPGVAFDFSLSGLRVNREIVTLPPALDTLTGTIDIRAKLEAGGATEPHALLLEVSVANAQLTGKDGSAVSAKRIAMPSLRINLVERTVDLGAVNVDTPLLVVRLSDHGVVLPFTPPADAGKTVWAVTSGDVVARSGTLRVLRQDTTTDMTLNALRWDGLQAKGTSAFELDATIEDGSIDASGTFSTDPPDLTVDTQLDKLPLPPLAELVQVLPLRLTQGSATGHLRLRYRNEIEELAGRLELRDVHTAPPSQERSVEVLAVSAAEVDFVFSTSPAPVVNIESLKLSYPYVLVQRRSDGVFPYDVLRSTTPGSAGAASYRPPAVRIARLAIEGGKVEFLDTTTEPTFWTAFTDLTVDAAHLRHPELTVGEFLLAAKHDELSPTVLSGSLTEHGLQARAELKNVLLETLNVYVSSALGYRFTSGRLTTTATTTPAPPLLKSTAEVVLRGIDLIQTGHDVIQEQSGVPLPIALSLISNASGDIHLTLPLAIDTQFQTVSFGSVFWQSVRQAIVGALTSPLRLLGSLFGKKGSPHAFAIDPIPFTAGSATLDRAGRERIAQIDRVLKAHPGLMLVLLPQVTDTDLGEIGAAGAAALAQTRNAAVRDAFVGAATDPLAPDRVILAPWKPADAAAATGKPGVYVELQDAS